jgi:hypothetical protein
LSRTGYRWKVLFTPGADIRAKQIGERPSASDEEKEQQRKANLFKALPKKTQQKVVASYRRLANCDTAAQVEKERCRKLADALERLLGL